MAENNSSIITTNVTNPYEYLKIVHNSEDDTLTRLDPVPITNPITNVQNCKDIPLNIQHKTWIRLFKPPQLQQQKSSKKDDEFSKSLSNNQSFPLIIYFHGGGFIMNSAASNYEHVFCEFVTTRIPAFIASVEYRLAPENRLPAAYDDAVEALNWVKNQALDTINGEQWLRNFVDFSKCFIMGCSAGGNIAYHACLRTLELDLEPIKISGFILNQPYFGGLRRTESELRLINNWMLPLVINDLMWELSLPIGANRDHVYCNPMVDIDNSSSTILGLVKKLGLIRMKCLVIGCDGDPLIDRQIEFVKLLKEKGVMVESCIEEGGFHGVGFSCPEKTDELCVKLKDFILGTY